MTTPQPGSTPTEQELRVLRAYIRHQGMKAAAASLDLAEGTCKAHLHNLRVRVGVTLTAELTYLLGPRLELWP